MSHKIAALLKHGALTLEHFKKMGDSVHGDSLYNHTRKIAEDYASGLTKEQVVALSSGKGEVHKEAISYAHVPFDYKEHLLKHPDKTIQRNLMMSGGIPPEHFDRIFKSFLNAEDSHHLDLASKKTSLSPDLIRHALTTPVVGYVKTNLLSNPAAPKDVLSHYAKNGTVGEKRAVASNYRTDPEDLHELSKHPEPDVQKKVAYNWSAKPETLAAMNHSDASIAAGIVDNPNTPKEKLKQLMDHPNRYVSDNAYRRMHE